VGGAGAGGREGGSAVLPAGLTPRQDTGEGGWGCSYGCVFVWLSKCLGKRTAWTVLCNELNNEHQMSYRLRVTRTVPARLCTRVDLWVSN
jgi:hypothetical protein